MFTILPNLCDNRLLNYLVFKLLRICFYCKIVYKYVIESNFINIYNFSGGVTLSDFGRFSRGFFIQFIRFYLIDIRIIYTGNFDHWEKRENDWKFD